MNNIALAATLALAVATLCPEAQALTRSTTKAKTPATTSTTTADSTPKSSNGATTPKTRKISAAEAALIEQYVNLQDAAIATFLELGKTLAGVSDKASADAAAPAVRVAGEQLCTIISAVEALGEPSESVQQAIMARVANVAEKKHLAEQVMEPMLTLMMQEPPCYGSEALYNELDALLANLQGAAGIDEDEADAPLLQEPDAE